MEFVKPVCTIIYTNDSGTGDIKLEKGADLFSGQHQEKDGI